MFPIVSYDELCANGYTVINGRPFYRVSGKYINANPTISKEHAESLASFIEQNNAVSFSADYYLNGLYFERLYNTFGYFVDVKPFEGIPGHFYRPINEQVFNYGPVDKCEILFVGEAPSYAELNNKRNLCGDYAEALFRELDTYGISYDILQRAYLTNVIRIYPFPKERKRELILDFLPLLLNEVLILEPKYIVCLGTTAFQCFSRKSLSSSLDNPIIYNYTVYPDRVCTAQIVGFPLTALHEQRTYTEFQRCVRKWSKYVYFKEPKPKNEVEYEIINSAEQLEKLVNDILSRPGLKRVSLDLEWHGRVPYDADSYVRIVSLALDVDKAYLIEICDVGGKPVFSPSLEEFARIFERLYFDQQVQIIGHNFIADIPWLEKLGVSASKKFWFPQDNNLRNSDYPGIFDTIIAHHAWQEDGVFDLERSAESFLDVAPWSSALEQFIANYLKENKLLRKQLIGYGLVPKDILYPYGAADVINTLKLFYFHVSKLNAFSDDFDDGGYWRPYWINMKALPAFLEMFKTGIDVDIERLTFLTDLYMTKLNETVDSFRKLIKWPEFNYRSHPHCVSLLFGEEYLMRKGTIRPEDALCLRLKPIKTTQAGQHWSDEFQPGTVSPSTDLETCKVLARINPVVDELRKIRILDQVLKTVLRPPENYSGDEEEEGEFTGGLAFYICNDGKIHPRYYPLKETRRCSCKDPNLQNLSNSREEDYKEILGESYAFPIRSILKAPEGFKLVEIDLASAELLMLGVYANDESLIHDYYVTIDSEGKELDIHSLVCVLAFGLDCPPTKEGLKNIGKSHLRIAGKRIIFGLNYGRRVESCYIQLRNSGVNISLAEVEKIVDTIYTRYSKIRQFQMEVKARVQSPGWIRNCFGSFRHFGSSRNKEIRDKMEREALNFPCQSGVADAMSLILHNLSYHELKEVLNYKIVLHNHDACVCIVPDEHLDVFCNRVVKECFQDRMKFKACNLDGIPISNKLYYFGYEIKVGQNW